jgi:flagellar secretion chaperone FliS
MAVAQTKAASYIQEHTEEISSHQIISLLMDGALERIDQAIRARQTENWIDLEILSNKLVAIINGLRNSLNMSAGGEIAENLDSLYEYMIEKITQTPIDKIVSAFDECAKLLNEIKLGWDQMALEAIAVAELE